MKLSRLVCLLVPVAALVACSSAPVDAPEKTGASQEDVTVLFNQCQYASCDVDYTSNDTPANLVALGCTQLSTSATYQGESGNPYYIGGETVYLPVEGWFTQCPVSVESATMTRSCNYCLGTPAPGYFWYEYDSTKARPCTSGCLKKAPPVYSYP